jgi:hypothetical protein
MSKLVSKYRAISMSRSAGAMANGVLYGQILVIPAFQRLLGVDIIKIVVIEFDLCSDDEVTR